MPEGHLNPARCLTLRAALCVLCFFARGVSTYLFYRPIRIRGEQSEQVNPLALALEVRRIPSLWVMDWDGVIRAAGLEKTEEADSRLADIMAGQG
jgi:hypothetical protein